jgi:hypothetical protein
MQPRQDKSLLVSWYRHAKANEPTKEAPLPFVIFESSFISVSAVCRGQSSLVSLGAARLTFFEKMKGVHGNMVIKNGSEQICFSIFLSCKKLKFNFVSIF